jgi:hypothetical protein
VRLERQVDKSNTSYQLGITYVGGRVDAYHYDPVTVLVPGPYVPGSTSAERMHQCAVMRVMTAVMTYELHGWEFCQSEIPFGLLAPLNCFDLLGSHHVTNVPGTSQRIAKSVLGHTPYGSLP